MTWDSDRCRGLINLPLSYGEEDRTTAYVKIDEPRSRAVRRPVFATTAPLYPRYSPKVLCLRGYLNTYEAPVKQTELTGPFRAEGTYYSTPLQGDVYDARSALVFDYSAYGCSFGYAYTGTDIWVTRTAYGMGGFTKYGTINSLDASNASRAWMKEYEGTNGAVWFSTTTTTPSPTLGAIDLYNRSS